MRNRTAAFCLAAIALPCVWRRKAPTFLHRAASSAAPSPLTPNALRLSGTATSVLRLSNGSGASSAGVVAGLSVSALASGRRRASRAARWVDAPPPRRGRSIVVM